MPKLNGEEYHERDGIPIWPFALVMDHGSDNPNYPWWAMTVVPDLYIKGRTVGYGLSEDEAVAALAMNVAGRRRNMVGRTAHVVKVTA